MPHQLPLRLAATSQNVVGISTTCCSVMHRRLKRSGSFFWGYPTGDYALLS